MSLLIHVLHWMSVTVFSYIFGYAGIKKLYQEETMMMGMEELGFGVTWTLVIGLAEVLGTIGVLAGIFVHPIKIISVLLLMPFAIGAFTMHMSQQHPFSYYWQSLVVCVLSIVILWTDQRFEIVFK